MAEKVIRILIDDISGEEIADGEGRRVVIGYEGASYQLDLSNENIEELEAALDPYIKAGKKLSNASRPRQRAASGSGRSTEELARVRAWAEENGYEVSARGRVRQEILDAYDASK
ncbi:Lsr2 family protein [Dietzia maris]|nr:Lsr2 family protein [Dietzia maris]MBB0998309.1 Lsr2 family protein [Dietzia maris]